MARKYDDFDDQDQDGAFDQILSIVADRKREFAIACVAAAVILLGLIVWGTSGHDKGDGSVPIVRADAGDYKTTPENPGGMEIPYRDSTVFSSNANSNEGGTENILADKSSEEPVPRSQLFAGLNTADQQPQDKPQDVTADETTGGEVEQTEAALAKNNEAPSNDALVKEAIGTANSPAAQTTTTAATKPAPVVAPEEPKSETIASAATTVPPEAVKAKPKATSSADKAAAKAAKTEPAAGASSAAKAVTPGGYYIQVGSVRAESGASSEWKKIEAKYSSLSGLKYRTQEANLGAKGTFYRIQAGPMSKDSATSICNSIKAKTPGACLVTK